MIWLLKATFQPDMADIQWDMKMIIKSDLGQQFNAGFLSLLVLQGLVVFFWTSVILQYLAPKSSGGFALILGFLVTAFVLLYSFQSLTCLYFFTYWVLKFCLKMAIPVLLPPNVSRPTVILNVNSQSGVQI